MAGPTLLGNAIQTGIDWYTLWAIGSLGGQALAVYGLGRTITSWAGAALWALGTGNMALIARYLGADDDERVRRTIAQSIVFTFILTCIVVLTCSVFAKPLLSLVARDRSLVDEGVTFLRWYLFSLLGMVMIYMVLSTFRAAGESLTAMKVQMLTNVVQVILIAGLTFGISPFPRLGALGVPAGILLSRVVGVSTAIWLFVTGRSRVRASARDFISFRFDFRAIKTLLMVTGPNAAEAVLRSTERMALNRIIASAGGGAALSAYAIGNQLESVYDMISSAFGISAAAAVGQNLGAGRPHMAESECHKSAKVGIAVAVGLGIIAFAFAGPITGFFTTTPDVLDKGTLLIRILAFSAPFYMVMANYLAGIRGAGDTRTPALIIIGTSWFVEALGAYLAIGVFGLGTTGVWGAMAMSYAAQGVLALVAFRRGSWKNTSF
jgi:putative MATE family efflux protein